MISAVFLRFPRSFHIKAAPRGAGRPLLPLVSALLVVYAVAHVLEHGRQVLDFLFERDKINLPIDGYGVVVLLYS
jgi:hypothetical protein